MMHSSKYLLLFPEESSLEHREDEFFLITILQIFSKVVLVPFEGRDQMPKLLTSNYLH